jgi:hypothetical protein
MSYRIPEPETPFTCPMAAERMTYCMECIGWSDSTVARRLQIADRDVQRMRKGLKHIPLPVARWLENLAAVHRAMPQPGEWIMRDNPIGPYMPELAEERTIYKPGTRRSDVKASRQLQHASEPDDLDMLEELN